MKIWTNVTNMLARRWFSCRFWQMLQNAYFGRENRRWFSRERASERVMVPWPTQVLRAAPAGGGGLCPRPLEAPAPQVGRGRDRVAGVARTRARIPGSPKGTSGYLLFRTRLPLRGLLLDVPTVSFIRKYCQIHVLQRCWSSTALAQDHSKVSCFQRFESITVDKNQLILT